MVGKQFIVRRPEIEAAGFDDAVELGSQRLLALQRIWIAGDIEAAELGGEPIYQASANFIGD